MPTYVGLFNFTEQGFRDIKETVKRMDAAKKAAAQIGETIKEVVWLQGQYDLMILYETTDEDAANAFLLTNLKGGNIRGQTLRAFTAAEMEKILERVP
jgi:uncharacterized protein with GYD domain